MGLAFNADEVLQMAERAETNAAAFYRKAARLRPSTEHEQIALLNRLAEMEDRHLATFATMRRELPERMREATAFDPYLEATLYLEHAADTHGGEGSPAAAEQLTGGETMEAVLRLAIGLERNSILFYLGLQNLVPPKLGQDKVAAIIAEERSHVAALVTELRQLGNR